MKPTKIIYDIDQINEYSEFIFSPIEVVELDYKVGDFGEIFPPEKFKLISDHVVETPLLKTDIINKIIKPIGKQELYLLRLRSGYIIKGFTNPETLDIDVYYSTKNSLLFGFYNTGQQDEIVLRLTLLEDTDNLYIKIKDNAKDLRFRVKTINELFNKKEQPNESNQGDNIFRFNKEKKKWEITYNGKEVKISSHILKGFTDIHFLLKNPSSSISSLTIFNYSNDLFTKINTSKKSANKRSIGESNFKLIDKITLNNTKKRIAELKNKNKDYLNEPNYSEDFLSQSLVDKNRIEIRDLEKYLKASIGEKGKSRKSKSPNEKAYDVITKRKNTAIEKIEIVDKSLATHLYNCINLGEKGKSDLIYTPEKEMNWILD